MGMLHKFADYILERRAKIAAIEQRLLGLQSRYESFFQEVSRVREGELGQLAQLIAAQRDSLSPDLDRALRDTHAELERDYDARIRDLETQVEKLDAEAEATRQRSLEAEHAIRSQNADLDGQEEDLKARNALLLEQIRQYNERIRRLGGGFGFFLGFFKMRSLHAQRRAIDREQADVAARIDALRSHWAGAEKDHATTETELRDRWVELRAEAESVRTKLEYLAASRERIVSRSVLEKILFELYTKPTLGTPGEPACARCASPNPARNHFCAYCAQRLGEDRTDLAGSWEEIAEINYHHALFADGMKASQEIIGLVRGLGTGLDNFLASVTDMIDTERKYPVPSLSISVPPAAVDWSRTFDELEQMLHGERNLHPLEFAGQVRALLDRTFTEESIKGYFETMGNELSVQAAAQWD